MIRNGAKTISYQRCLGDLMIRNGAKTISLPTLFGRLNYDCDILQYEFDISANFYLL
jgi:hypothetical protein